MKQFFIVFFVVVSGVSFAQGTLPVIPFGDRKADLYYWDTNWYDRYEHINPNISPYPGVLYNYAGLIGAADMYIGRVCITDTPMLVKGIAGVLHLRAKTWSTYTEFLDTTISGRVPEQFKLYSSNYELLGEGDVDESNPSYKMDFRNGNKRDTFKVFEVYFDKPVLVSGRFFVGGTTHNNRLFGSHADFITPPWEHKMHTAYPYFYGGSSLLPSPPEILEKYYSPYEFTHPIGDSTYGSYLYDTSAFHINMWYHFIPFFAIIDTDYVYYDCQRPTGLGVIEADLDSITISWGDDQAESWDVVVWTDGIEPDSGAHYDVGMNRLTLYGLNMDSTYNVKVRAVCDTMHINTSTWSNVFSFKVSDYYVEPCDVPEGLQVQLLPTAGDVFVRWDYADVADWELAVWGDNDGDTMLIHSQVEYVDVASLDTARWYSVRVRAWCDSARVSEWSDTVRFFVPNWDTTGGGGEPVGIDVDTDRNIQLQPNPTSDKVTVQSSISMRKIELFGSDGKRIADFDASGFASSLDLSAYPAGTYIVRITTSAGMTTKRLVRK